MATPFPNTGLYRRLEAEGRLLHKNWALYDVEHVVFRPKRMSPERLQDGLEWTWRQSYRWGSLAQRITGAPWSILPLWVSLNLGYRYYARHLNEKTWPVYRDQAYMAENASHDEQATHGAAGTRSCGGASGGAADTFVELSIR
ncbi:MAG TPA: hypothetical protein VL371_21040 [Gemmataceae bacterium]|nr:hypothetical protein [Gemmataceae bacterium]